MFRTRFAARVARAAVIVVFASGVVVQAVAAPWSTPATLATGTVQFAAGGPDGTFVVAWRQPAAGGAQVFAAVKAAAGSWVHTDGLPVGALPTSAVVDGAGNVMTVWATGGAATAAYLPAGTATWQVTPIAAEPVANGAVVAVDASGHYTAAWVHTPDPAASCVVRSSTWTSGAGAWSAPTSLSPGGECAHVPVIAVNAAGRAVALWAGPWAVGIYVSLTAQIRVAERAADGTWAPSVVLQPAARVQYGKYSGVTGAVLSPSGDATAVWFTANKVWAASKPAGATAWSKKKSIGSSGTYPYTRLIPESGLAADAAGNIEVFYAFDGYNTRTMGYFARIKTSVLPVGGTWVAGGMVANDKTGGAGGFGTRIAVDPASSEFGLLWGLWNDTTGEFAVQSVHTVASTWSKPVDVLGSTAGDPPGAVPSLGLAQAGNLLLAAWTDQAGNVVYSTLVSH